MYDVICLHVMLKIKCVDIHKNYNYFNKQFISCYAHETLDCCKSI